MTVLAETREATKRFGSFTAVSAVGISVGSGEVVGLLGGNGAGKTTLIRLLLGLLRPTSGTIRLLGAPPSLSGRRRVGYVPQTLGLYAGLTVAENWAFTTAAYGDRKPGRLPDNISAWRRDLVGDLPLGAQRQVAFAAALSHRPELLILDEPTSGVGPLGSARLWEEIRAAADHGAGVLVTTHNMEEAEQCDRLVVMAGGQVMARGTAGDIIADRKVTEVRCGDLNRAFVLLDSSGLPVQLHGPALRVGGTADAVTGLLAGAGIEAVTESVPANLEEAFVAIVGNATPAGNTANAAAGTP
ncbi:MAG TPA: ABC transporter ATP-binding protein [Streptosporangiaceae bacterium]